MKTQIVVNSILIALLLLLCEGNILAEDSIPFTDSLKNANVIIPSIGNGQTQGLMIGNGDMYGLIYTKGQRLHLRITKNDIWDARVDTSKDGPLPKVDITNGTVTGSRNAPPSYKLPYPRPVVGASLLLGKNGSTSKLSGHLDIGKGVATVKSDGKIETVLRVLHDHNVLFIRSPFRDVEIHVHDGQKGTTDGVEWVKRTLPGDVDYKGMSYAVALASKGDLKAVSLVTSFEIRAGDVVERAVALAGKVIAQEEEALLKAHENAWDRYWSKSGIQLDDKVVEKWWYRMLYFAKTVCKPGTAPVALMPPLATDVTPWHADLHHNYNAWQAFWPLPAANHPELVDPWISYNHSMIPRFKWLAKTTYGIKGLHVPISSFLHEPDPAACKSKNKRQMSMNPWGLTIGLQAMTLQAMWQKYLIDQDVAYMKETIYPFAKEVATFYVEFMAKCKKDDQGKILLGPSYSPEHGSWGIYNCPFDIAYVHYAFDVFIEAAGVLKQDAELAGKCLKYKALLGPYPTALNKNRETFVVDWKDGRKIQQHNIEVPASPVFPADQVTWFSPESDKQLFLRTFKETHKTGDNSHVMFNVAKARLSVISAVDDAKAFFVPRTQENGFFKMPWAHGTYMQEMIGVVGLVNEFLLQSVDNKIRLFPCWPKEQSARFERLRAQGGFIVSAEFKGGRVVSATIESTSVNQLRLLSPWKTIYANGKQKDINPDGLVTLNTKPDQVFLFAEIKQK